jgi:ATP-dependent RNA helicase SUPV3L1/SUV3
MRNGTFGTTGRCPRVRGRPGQALESHAFEPVKVLQWRNTELDFASIESLRDSLDQIPASQGLTRVADRHRPARAGVGAPATRCGGLAARTAAVSIAVGVPA